MIGRTTRSKRTVREFVERLNPPASDFPLFRAYYCTLRRRGLGQTSALIAALLGLKYSLTEIKEALGRNYRSVWERWSNVQKKFRFKGVIALLEFLQDPSAWRDGRRSKPTPQERPFDRPGRPPVFDAGKRAVGRSGSIVMDRNEQREANVRRAASDGQVDHGPLEPPTDCAG